MRDRKERGRQGGSRGQKETGGYGGSKYPAENRRMGTKKKKEVVRGIVRKTKGERKQCHRSQKVKYFQKRWVDSKDDTYW